MIALRTSAFVGATIAFIVPLNASAQDSDDSSNALATSADKPHPPCKGPFKHHIILHVYDITPNLHNATTGLSNKNAVNTLGAMTLFFGDGGAVKPALEKYYDNGLIEMVHVSLSSWGDFLHCDKSCHCPKKSCDMKRPGNFTRNGTTATAYSFPHAGEGKYWDYDKGSGCGNVEVKASCVIDHLASQAGCPGICGSNNTENCANCIKKLSNKAKEHVWDAAIFNETCPDSRRRRSKRSDSSLRRPYGEVIV